MPYEKYINVIFISIRYLVVFLNYSFSLHASSYIRTKTNLKPTSYETGVCDIFKKPVLQSNRAPLQGK